jgi:hypothetical protein
MVECTISHDGRFWRLTHERFSCSAVSLSALDAGLGRRLRQNGLCGKGQKVQVFMAFDNAVIPQWIRQYAQHYFNRLVEVEGS